MNDPPGGKFVDCPECDREAVAIVPQGSRIVEPEENADGKVWANCSHCGDQFIVYYRR